MRRKMKKGELIVTLDVGTTKTCVMVGEVNPGRLESDNSMIDLRDSVNIIGVGVAPSKGVKRGIVVNIEEASGSIRKAIEDAESMSGVSIKAGYAGIKGRHIEYIKSHGIVAVKGGEITDDDVDNAVESAKAIALPFDRRLLHVITKGFSINGQNGIYDPRGMEGIRLEADVQIITADAMSVHNLVKACEKAGIDVIGVVYEPISTSMALLSNEEKDIGVALIDIGGGTTDIAMFHEGGICHTSIIPVGGINFTHDIAIGLRTLPKDAEGIKIRHGSVTTLPADDDNEIEVSYSDERPGRKIPKGHLIEIIKPRAEELLYLVRDEMKKSGYIGMMASGVVLTGGGSLLRGIDFMAENILELPVRIGSVNRRDDLLSQEFNTPQYASSIGLLFYGVTEITREPEGKGWGILRGIITRLKRWNELIRS